MLKFILIIFAILSASGAFAGLKSDSVETGDVSRYERERREYEEIFWIQRDSVDGEWEITFKRVISRYEKFLEKIGNDSEFADDVKLRIAEFHQILGQKEKSKPYLDDIIKNHPDADVYSIKTGENTGDKTAAYALYWRAAWFGPKKGRLGDKKDLMAIFEKYRDSEGAVYEVLLLFNDENRARIIKNFGLNPKFYEMFNLKKAD